MSLCYHIVTYGCQMNVHDSEVMAGLLEAQGYFPAPSLEEADVIVLNTCCVRETAEERILGRLAELGRLRRRNPNLIVVLAGCLGQQEGTVERLRRRSAPVDVLMGTHNLHRLPDLVEEARRTRDLREGGPLVEVWPDGLAQTRELREGLPARRDRGVRAWVTIMYGCDNFCSYCIVPYVRGRERSRLPEDIVREVEDLASRGYREVVLLGQNVNSYGKDLDLGPGRSFSALLRRLDRVPGLARLRYTTSHPKDFTEDIIAVVSESEHVCENFHLPAQAGSDRILRLMNRGYTRKQYLDLLDRIRRHVPNAAITTDLIVGFPGETDEDFRDTLALVREARFASAFMFAYSPRRGTPAATLPDQVPHEVKLARLHRLIEIQNEVSLEQNRAEVGRVLSVLVEGPAEKDPGRSAGRTRTNKLVLLKAPEPPEDLVGQEVPVLIERATTWVLEGRAVT